MLLVLIVGVFVCFVFGLLDWLMLLVDGEEIYVKFRLICFLLYFILMVIFVKVMGLYGVGFVYFFYVGLVYGVVLVWCYRVKGIWIWF